MARFVMRVLAPSRLRRAVLGRFDTRYVTRADHRQDVRDALWEVQALKRELTALRREMERLGRDVKRAAPAGPDPAVKARAEEAHRLATETAAAVDHLLQAEVLLWQAVDGVRDQAAGFGQVTGSGEGQGADDGRAAGTPAGGVPAP
ncbi:hypothetical protein Sru01_44060 [Sphaerisporangium rufum]|uniref:Uncharacterized protein n=1 Tax=Sphaerisporangium rufum TaxID=1381558 RepID=A0A919V169_9ACTN|nr:hypothetical protein [Sphaerisporangium rufum]GII79424.1 hypothetical protein Sru01_44060 [Sphaerisporangium rufum]